MADFPAILDREVVARDSALIEVERLRAWVLAHKPEHEKTAQGTACWSAIRYGTACDCGADAEIEAWAKLLGESQTPP